ncbi:hypothetical protein V8C35DRAFT_319080 [Trichoderma chlorosporum]
MENRNTQISLGNPITLSTSKVSPTLVKTLLSSLKQIRTNMRDLSSGIKTTEGGATRLQRQANIVAVSSTSNLNRRGSVESIWEILPYDGQEGLQRMIESVIRFKCVTLGKMKDDRVSPRCMQGQG